MKRLLTLAFLAFASVASAAGTFQDLRISQDAQGKPVWKGVAWPQAILPSCTSGQVIEWDGAAWVCGTDGGGVWGAITGTLSTQIDLQAALDGKQTTAGLSDYSTTLKTADLITKGPWVDVRAFMDGQSGRPTLAAWLADQTINVTLSIQAAIDAFKHVKFPIGQFHFTSITVPSGRTLEGSADLNGGTDLYTNAAGYAITTSGGVLGIAGAKATNIALRNFQLIKEGGNSTSGIKFEAAANVSVDKVKIHGMNGGPSLYLNQVWDSWFDNGYIHSSTYAGPTTVLHYGGADDNTNNIRFRGWTWEGYANKAVEVIAGTGANNIYSIVWDSSKFESGTNTTPIIEVSAGVLTGSTIENSLLATPGTTQSQVMVQTTGTGYLDNVLFSGNTFISEYTSPHSGHVSLLNSQNVRFIGNKFQANGGWSGTPVITDAGSDRMFSLNNSYDSVGDLFSGSNTLYGLYTSKKIHVSKRISGTDYYGEIAPSNTSVDINTEDGTHIQMKGGTVGIGTVPSDGKLHVNGTVRGSSFKSVRSGAGTDFVGYLSNAAADAKYWDISQNANEWYLRFVNDAYTLNTAVITVNRTGYAPTAISFGAAISAPNFSSPLTGSGAPASTPTYIGQEYLDTAASKWYKAKGTASSADWLILN